VPMGSRHALLSVETLLMALLHARPVLPPLGVRHPASPWQMHKPPSLAALPDGHGYDVLTVARVHALLSVDVLTPASPHARVPHCAPFWQRQVVPASFTAPTEQVRVEDGTYTPGKQQAWLSTPRLLDG